MIITLQRKILFPFAGLRIWRVPGMSVWGQLFESTDYSGCSASETSAVRKATNDWRVTTFGFLCPLRMLRCVSPASIFRLPAGRSRKSFVTVEKDERSHTFRVEFAIFASNCWCSKSRISGFLLPLSSGFPNLMMITGEVMVRLFALEVAS